MADKDNNERSTERRKKYPIRCIDCGKKEVRPGSVSQQVQRNYDGRVYKLLVPDLPVTACNACGNVFFTEESDDRILAALRKHLVLLTPEQIRANIKKLDLSQKDAAQCLGVAPETLSRWLCGAIIQSRAMDNLLRIFFASPEVRQNLKAAERNPSFGEAVNEGMAENAPPAQGSRSRRAPFPMLEKHGQIERSREVARVIQEQHSVFSLTA